jgi:ParB family transcriptional regulator, chromosome partitioning protein
MTTRKALGRGLSALLREVDAPTLAGLDQIPVDRIDPNPYQPRRNFPEASLRELAESIRAGGLVQPVLLRRHEARYQLVVGERRWRAARLAGLEAVPAVVRELSDRETLELALTENLLREDLNPLDAAHGFEALQQKFHLSHEQIAERMGLDRSTVTNMLRLLRLPAKVQEMLGRGEITYGHARALLGLRSEAEQTQSARDIAKYGFSVRQVEEMVAATAARAQPGKGAASTAAKLDANTRAAVLELERTLGTKVKIVGDERRGKIEISYYSAEDLNRIYERIVHK